jgi:signal transduction histidine kinase
MYTPESAEYAKADVFPVFVKNGKIEGEELQLQRKDSSKIDVSLNVSAVYDDKGNILYGRSVWRDITPRKRLEKQLRHQQKMESIRTLAGGIAHDFNNILAIILGNTELATDEIPEGNPARHNIEEIQTAVLRAKYMVKQIVTLARKENDDRKPVKINPIIIEALKLLRHSIPANIDIRSNVPRKSEIFFADPTQINQVIINLCTNAVHAMEKDGGILEINLERVILEESIAQSYNLFPGIFIKLSVRDTGHGIDSKIKDRIFDPYFTTKEIGKGSGMGLAVVQGIVMNHDGAILVDSEMGKGTTVNMFFPIVEREPV